MLGRDVVKRFQKASLNPNSRINRCVGLGKADYRFGSWSGQLQDLLDMKAVDVVINCAAFTDTTKCEDQKFWKDSYIANVLGVQQLATACAYRKVKLVHISTDYVYSQHSYLEKPWCCEFPCNKYGMQKLLAEQFIKAAYAHWPEGQLVCRMSWLYGSTKKDLFLHKTVANAYKAVAASLDDPQQTAPSIKVVNDQIGSPQSTLEASWRIYNLVVEDVYGTVNCWDAGLLSRAAFAKQIVESWTACVDDRLALVHVEGCSSADFKTALQHPLFDAKHALPTGYLSTNGKYCKLSMSKFNKMCSTTFDCLKASESMGVGAFIRVNKVELKEHVFGMLSKDILDKLDTLCTDEPLQVAPSDEAKVAE